MEFLVQNFPSLSELKQYVPSCYSSNLATKPAVAAMKILFNPFTDAWLLSTQSTLDTVTFPILVIDCQTFFIL